MWLGVEIIDYCLFNDHESVMRAKGGDIDLLMECWAPVDNAGLAAARLAARIQMRIGECKIDVLYAWPGMVLSPAHRAALEQGEEF